MGASRDFWHTFARSPLWLSQIYWLEPSHVWRLSYQRCFLRVFSWGDCVVEYKKESPAEDTGRPWAGLGQKKEIRLRFGQGFPRLIKDTSPVSLSNPTVAEATQFSSGSAPFLTVRYTCVNSSHSMM